MGKGGGFGEVAVDGGGGMWDDVGDVGKGLGSETAENGGLAGGLTGGLAGGGGDGRDYGGGGGSDDVGGGGETVAENGGEGGGR